MAPIPPLTPSPPESKGARISPRTRSEVPGDAVQQSDVALIFVKLRKMIASDSQPTENILGAIAVAAHSLTGATGAAVAMPKSGVVVCVGRSGETAPELGERLNVDSGISGECLRTGVIMRCDDASRDLHVDAEVCRQLGLQSIAVVPLRGQHGRVGVLEAFSTESYAFSEEKMEILGRLAGLAEAAWARGAVTEVSIGAENLATTELTAVIDAPPELVPPPAFDPPFTPASVATVPLDEVRDVLAQHEEARGLSKWHYTAIALGILVAVGVLSVYGWREWYKASVPAPARQPAANSGSSRSTSGGVDAGVGFTPDVVRPSARPSGSAHAPKAVTEIAVPDEVIRRLPSRGTTGKPWGQRAGWEARQLRIECRRELGYEEPRQFCQRGDSPDCRDGTEPR